MFALLYFAQGAAMAYIQNFQKPYLSGLGISSSAIATLTQLLLLPFILKMLFALVSDRYPILGMGHRKPYMILGILIATAGFTSCAFHLPSEGFAWFSISICIASFGVALFDSTADGFAVESTKVYEQGIVQGSMVGGRALGVILMSLVFGKLAQDFGYRSVFLVIAVCILIPLYFVFKIPSNGVPRKNEQLKFRDFTEFFGPGVLIFIVYSISYSFVAFGHDGIITLYLSKGLGLLDGDIGRYGAFRGTGAVIGAVCSGYLLTVTNRWLVSYLALALIVSGIFASAYFLSTQNFLAMGTLWGIAWGFQETVFVTLAMSKASPKFAGASFALLMAFSNVGTSLGDGWATNLTAQLPFPDIFVKLGLIGLLSPLALFLVQQSTRKPVAANAPAL